MSTLVEVKDVRQGDMFEMPGGSVYAAAGFVHAAGAAQARLWCAHPPDPMTFDPPLIELPPEQTVRLLSGAEAGEHYRHDGYVESVFRQEMDRRHQAMMLSLEEKWKREAAEQRQREHARRPWGKKVFD